MGLPIKLINYINHCLYSRAEQVEDEFVRDFKLNILSNTIIYPEFERIEKYRASLLNNNSVIETAPLGAVTRTGQKRRTISSIARTASVNAKYGQLLFRLARIFKPDQIVELGTALGISTMYLALGNPASTVITVEGDPQLSKIASESFSFYGLHSITPINSTFDDAIPMIIPGLKNNALVFIDGNHTFEATLRYYRLFSGAPGSFKIMVLDDINWSYPMMKAWKSITGSASCSLIIDLFRLGIIFQGQHDSRQKLRLRY